MKRLRLNHALVGGALCLLSISAFADCSCGIDYNKAVQTNKCGIIDGASSASSLEQLAGQLGAISTCSTTNATCNFTCTLLANQAAGQGPVSASAPRATQPAANAFGTNQPQARNLPNNAANESSSTTQKSNKSISWF